MTYTILVPAVDSAAITPNPANINEALSISVEVSEHTIVLTPEYNYCGDFICGQEG